jgi:hypothetical protein
MARVSSMMSNNQHTHCVFLRNPEQHRIGETVHQSTANSGFNNRVVKGIVAYSLYRPIDFCTQLIAEPGTF